MAKWYEIIKASAPQAAGTEEKTADIHIYGNIGDRWDENGVIAADLVREIAALDVDAITLRINSYGGSVPDGLAIYNALKRHRAAVDVHVDGVAISCASYIAMAGDTITMAKNSQMMIHAPWSFAYGNAVDLREQADILDRYAKAMASAYADKSGKTYDDALALLTDGKDHWFLADEALAEGFADAVGEEAAVAASLANSFDLSRFKAAAPAAAIAPPQVPQPTAAAVTTKEASMPAPVPAAGQTAATPFARTKDDNAQVIAMFKPFASRPEIAALQTEVLADPALTIETIQARLLAEMGRGAEPANPQGAFPSIQTVSDETDKVRAAAVEAIMVKAGLQKATAGNPFNGAKMADIAADALRRAGKPTSYDPEENVRAAFTQGTSDFPIILDDAMHKALQAGYALESFTWQRFCAIGSLNDLRPHGRYRMSGLGNLDPVNELGEFVNKTIGDGEKATITGSTKGNVINISAEALINDDLGAFIGLANSLGRSSARTVEADVYALLALNSGLGPVLWDSKTLFHADHGNLTTSAAITMAALDLDRVAMAMQKDVGANDYLDLRPAVLVVNTALGGTAKSINDAQYDPDTANKLQKPNMVRGLFRDVVETPRVAGARRYLFADASVAPVIEVSFLNGVSTPEIRMEEGFDIDGTRWRVRMRYGVAAIDYRGAVTNAGG